MRSKTPREMAADYSRNGELTELNLSTDLLSERGIFMNLYLAPMEGITTYIYRNAYNHYFGGIDKYFTPFLASKKLNRRELNEILPER